MWVGQEPHVLCEGRLCRAAARANGKTAAPRPGPQCLAASVCGFGSGAGVVSAEHQHLHHCRLTLQTYNAMHIHFPPSPGVPQKNIPFAPADFAGI